MIRILSTYLTCSPFIVSVLYFLLNGSKDILCHCPGQVLIADPAASGHRSVESRRNDDFYIHSGSGPIFLDSWVLAQCCYVQFSDSARKGSECKETPLHFG